MCVIYYEIAEDPRQYGQTKPTFDVFERLDECPERRKMPLHKLKLHHAQVVIDSCDGNISEAARRLGLHRRTLQRFLRGA